MVLSLSSFCSSLMFLITMLTDVVSKHMHFTSSTMFQAKIALYTAAGDTFPDVNLGTSSLDQLQKPGQEDYPLSNILLRRSSSNVELKAQTSSLICTMLFK